MASRGELGKSMGYTSVLDPSGSSPSLIIIQWISSMSGEEKHPSWVPWEGVSSGWSPAQVILSFQMGSESEALLGVLGQQ